MKNHNGTLYGVGVGPGDPELLTLKAARLIRECDLIAIPQKNREDCFALKIASGTVPQIAEKPVLSIDMPMTRDPETREKAYRLGVSLLQGELEKGKNVVFLTIGDPSVYSTFCYLHERLLALGFCSVIVPGVTSFCAAAAALSLPLCENREELHIIPGRADYEAALAYPGTKVFMKGDLKNLKKALEKSELEIAAAENCTTSEERLYLTLDEIPADAGYYTVIIAKEKQP